MRLVAKALIVSSAISTLGAGLQASLTYAELKSFLAQQGTTFVDTGPWGDPVAQGAFVATWLWLFISCLAAGYITARWEKHS